MKIVYKLLIMGMVYLLSNTTYAQIQQYSDDGTESCIDCEEKGTETERCFCLGIIQLGLFNQYMPIDNTQQTWLQNQENILKEVMKGRPTSSSFSQVQKEYFEKTLIDNAEEYYRLVDKHFRNLQGYDEKKLESSTLNFKVLEIRKNEGISNASTYGDLKFEDRYLKDIPNSQIEAYIFVLKQIRKEQRDALKKYDINRQQLQHARTNNQFTGYLVNEYIKHYNSLDYEDAIRFMTAYITSVNIDNTSKLPVPFGNNPNIYEVINRNHTEGLAGIIAFNPYQNNPITFPELPEDQALFNYALDNHIKVPTEWFDGRNEVKNDLKKHLEMVRYYGQAMNIHSDILRQWRNGSSYGSADINLTADNNTIVFQDETRQNMAMNVVFPDNTWTGISLRGYNNFLNSLFSNRIPRPEFEGEFIKDAFEDNQITIPLLSYDEIAAIFDVGRFNYPIIGPPQMPIVFEGTLGQTLWSAGLRLPSMFELPYVIEGFQTLARGETFDFAFRKKVYELTINLNLSSSLESYLIYNLDKTELVYKYYSSVVNNGSLSIEEIKYITNAISVLREFPDVNPFLSADCRSFEYAQPPGASQKACAVQNFNHRFYTAGIRPNGSPYGGFVEVNSNGVIYFTMPSWMTNGRAANLTAKAVSAAIKATDVYFFDNPDAVETDIQSFFNNELVIQLKTYGGRVTYTPPFNIPSPAPYITNLLGVGDPFDCE
ncbi:hypothetical protein [Aquimarina sediminis]|uniref:hypothetical protein n=1 Tax=Aquimarina sediminis TaxID=2070536 RepID=UPI000FFEDA31|nr:hypothetical protein [Aquimarina sediminis]